ncbi:unnamed protein product [Choristocarpus tenellus]
MPKPMLVVNVQQLLPRFHVEMLGGGGVDGAIHNAAGRELVEACRKVEMVEHGIRCRTGEAHITPGFRLKAKHVIHTAGPIYQSQKKSAPLLWNSYKVQKTGQIIKFEEMCTLVSRTEGVPKEYCV